MDHYRCRSAYKLLELNDKFHLFKEQSIVVSLKVLSNGMHMRTRITLNHDVIEYIPSILDTLLGLLKTLETHYAVCIEPKSNPKS